MLNNSLVRLGSRPYLQSLATSCSQGAKRLSLPIVVSARFASRRSKHLTPLQNAVMPEPAELFNFTRGRFVRNETHEMTIRHRSYNVEELTRVAMTATDAQQCVQVTKYADGMHNRALLLTMDNGSQVVAKIPNPNAGQAHFTTASEAATMDYVREALGRLTPYG